MTKVELAAAMSEKSTVSVSKPGMAAIIDTMTGIIQSTDKVEIRGFGTFQFKTRAAKKGRNPQTGAEVQIPEKRVLTFKPAKVKDDSLTHSKAK